MSPKTVSSAPCQQVVGGGPRRWTFLLSLPIQHCWPGDVAPLITLGPGRHPRPHKNRARTWASTASRCWAPTRSSCAGWPTGRALDFRAPEGPPGQPFPVAVVLGCDPATILGAVTPVPDSAVRIPVRRPCARRQDRAGEMPGLRPAPPAVGRDRAEGVIHPARPASKAPATTPATTEQSEFPVFTIERITSRRDPIYHSTFTGKPPDEPAMLAWRSTKSSYRCCRSSSRRSSIYLPPEGCSYRLAVVSIRSNTRPRQAGDVRHLEPPAPVHVHQVHHRGDDGRTSATGRRSSGPLTTRMDATRDTTLVDNTRSITSTSPARWGPAPRWADATNKWPGETNRGGTPIVMDEVVKQRVDAMWGWRSFICPGGTAGVRGRGRLKGQHVSAAIFHWPSAFTQSSCFHRVA